MLPTLAPRVSVTDTGLVGQLGGGERIRGSALQKIRHAHFEKHPLCVACLAKTPPEDRMATELDHKIPLHQGGPDIEANRQGLCSECHLEKSKTERGHTYKPRA